MPFPKILNNNEINAFDNPPNFNSEDRKKYFNMPKWAEETIADFRDDKNKLVFILLTGYFRCWNKFFVSSKFNEKDMNFVINKFDLSVKNLNLEDFSRATFLRYRDTILRNSGISSFNEQAKHDLIQEAKAVISKRFKMKAIFMELLDVLYAKKIEIPTYNALAEIITDVVNEYEKNLQDKISILLDSEKKALLDEFLEKIEADAQENPKPNRYKITNLKKFSHSTKPGKIKGNTDTLKLLKTTFYKLQDVIIQLNLSTETIEYYANWSIKADNFQILIKNPDKKYLYLICFILHQYFTLQDLLIDILLLIIQNTSNTATREHKDNYYQERTEREKKIVNIAETINDNIFSVFDKIEEILFHPDLPYQERVETGQNVILIYKNARNRLEKDIDTIKVKSEKTLKGSDYFEVLETKSIKLQNRVSEIVKNIEFDRETSSKNIMEAIDYYRAKDGAVDYNAPDEFINDDKKIKALIDDKGRFRVSLYKVFLFEEIAKGIKSDILNLKYSYRYKSINKYMMDKETFKANKPEILRKCELEGFAEPDLVLAKLQKEMEYQYNKTNRNIITGKNKYISFKNDNTYTLITPKIEKDEIQSVSDLFSGQENIPLSEILSDVNEVTSFLDSFEHYNLKGAKEKPYDNVFFAGITGYGCNIGIKRIAKISKGVNEKELENTLNWYFSPDNINSANNRILSFTNQLDLPNVFKRSKKNNHTSSDGQKYSVQDDSLTGNYSFKYFGKGKGVSVYSFIDERHLLFHSTVISSSEREAGYVIDGLLNNDVVESSIHSTDTHGYTEIIFAITHLLGFSFAPRIKNFKDKSLYCFNAEMKNKFEEKGYKILPNAKNYINTKVIKENWDDILRFIATIKLKETTASQLLKRLSSYSRKHRLYQALNEFGKIIHTIFTLKYIDDVILRQAIEKQLNKVESVHKFAKVVFFGNNQEFEYATKEEQEIAESCKRLIENAIICWNYLYLSQKISDTKDEKKKEHILEIIKNGSIVVWKHINLYGEYDFSEKISKHKTKFDIPKILDLNVA